TGALTLIQSGFFNAGASGRCAFSGWRGLLLASRMTVMEAPALTYGCATADASRMLRQCGVESPGKDALSAGVQARSAHIARHPIAANYRVCWERRWAEPADTQM